LLAYATEPAGAVHAVKGLLASKVTYTVHANLHEPTNSSVNLNEKAVVPKLSGYTFYRDIFIFMKISIYMLVSPCFVVYTNIPITG
jgi:hypothetical protein